MTTVRRCALALLSVSLLFGCGALGSSDATSMPKCSNTTPADRVFHPAVSAGQVQLGNANFQQLVDVPQGTTIKLAVAPVNGSRYQAPSSSDDRVLARVVADQDATQTWNATFTARAPGAAQIRAETPKSPHEVVSLASFCLDVVVTSTSTGSS